MVCAIVDERISEKCERALQKFGFYVIKAKASKALGEAVKSHPDMLMFKDKNRIITSAEYCDEAPYIFSDIREYSPSTEISFTADSFSKEYPSDAIFNALVLNGCIYIREQSVSKSVRDYAKEAGLKTVAVNQGYPACTVLGFGRSAITADKGMAEALRENGINVTLTENGCISLPPYEYGFIGGAAGVFGDKIYFLGDIGRHKNYELIEAAIKAERYTPVSLSDEPLSDLGKIIFI